jgi:WD40 repeat protein
MGGVRLGRQKTVKIWDLESGQCLATLEGHTNQVVSVAITPDGKRILSGSRDHTIRVWDALQLEHQTTLEIDGMGLSVSPFPDNERVFIGLASNKNVVELWSFSSGRRLWGQKVAGYSKCVAIDKKGKSAVSGQSGGDILLWNLEMGECLAKLKGHSALVNSVQITPDGRFAVSGSNDKTVKVWDLEARTCVGTLEGHSDSVMSVAISPDGALIASTGFQDQTVRLWDRKSGACLEKARSARPRWHTG